MSPQHVIDGFIKDFVQDLHNGSVNRPGFELTPRSWTVETPLIMRYFSAGIPPG